MKRILTALFTLCAFQAVMAQTTLPTTWSFTTTTFPNGWTTLGTAYYTGSGNTPPALKLDNTGDWLQIWFASAPGPLTYYITGNSFSGGTFEVQESPNGTTWTTMRTFTANMPTAYTQFTDQPASASRYVRFNYTTKVSGNVGLDDVNLGTPAAGPSQEIDVLYNAASTPSGGSIWTASAVSTTTPVSLSLANLGLVNTLNISSVNVTGTNAAEFVVQSFPATVSANSNSPLNIDFTPTASGTRTATITINSDDADEPAYVININGAGGGLASEPTAQASGLSFSNVKSYRFQVNYTAASPACDGYIVLRRDDVPVTDAPFDGLVYGVGDVVGNSKVAYAGTGTSFWANYIGAGQNYYFAVFAYNGPGQYRNYLNASPLAGTALSAGSMQPANYYSGISTAAPTFISDLTALTNPHTDNFYSNYAQRMVTSFWARDTVNGQRVVTCVYSGEKLIYTEPFGWVTFSREHTFAHSWMPGYPSNTNMPEYSDYFNLFPTNQNNANALRSNYPLGEVVNATTTYLGCKLGTDANGHTVFEPRDEQKGDAARAMFYMATCYNSTSQNWSFPNPILNMSYGQDQNLLKAWHYQDPPDAREIARNDYVDSLQGNRNPFIDSVNYACYIDFSNMTKINGPVIPCSASSIGITENNAVRPQIGLWPNPTAGQFSLFYTTTINEPVVVRLIDVTGRVVFTQQYTSASGSNLFTLDLSAVARGVYTLQVNGETTVSEKLILQ
jgi:Endonuclease I/Secretion system C-terminal sorting domain